MRPIRHIGVAAVAALAIMGTPAHAQAPLNADFQLSKPSPCYAGSCRVTVVYSLRDLPAPVRLEIDWGTTVHDGFVAGYSTRCGRFEDTDVLYALPLPVSGECAATSPRYSNVGTTKVRVRISDPLGLSAIAEQDLAVIAKPVRTETKTKRRPGKTTLALCLPVQSGVNCGPGNGRRTAGGGEKVPHTGWPAITGILWHVIESGRSGHKKVGGPLNDELLGHHGSDRLAGGAGKDVLWGDWDPLNNNTSQRDVLRGGAGNDFLYPSHGPSQVYGGPGNDYVWAYYGRGVIDCGPGRDTARVKFIGNKFKLRNCEIIRHFCAFGEDGKGGCRKPGDKRRKT